MLTTIASLILAGGVTVTLPMEANVRGTEIQLGEVAQILGTNPSEVEAVKAVELGYAPAPGYSRLLFAERIRLTLAKEVPGIEVRVVGQKACRVHPEVEEVSGDEIRAAAFVELQQAYGKSEATFELKEPIPRVAVPSGRGAKQLRVKHLPKELRSGTVSVPVEVLVDNVRYRTIWTSWDVEVWQTKLVLAQEVRAGEILAPGLFQRQRVRVTHSANTLLGADQLLGAVASRDLKPGELITHKDVHRPQVIEVGNSVFLRVRKGDIQAQVPGIAMQGGAIGDRIRIRATGSGQELNALVISRDICEINLGS